MDDMDDMEEPAAPRALRDPDARARRRELLDARHMRPLNEYVAGLRKRSDIKVHFDPPDGPQVDNAQPPARIEVPDFDPLDGGVDAIILFLFEKPGPMTSTTTGARTRTGSGFISRDNDDSTAENTFTFMREAGIPRKQTVTWNVVPWWDGTTKVTAADLREGAEETRRLMGLLPRLRVVVFVGKKALRARPHLEDTGLAFFSSYHPSPKVRATRPDKWREIPSVWARAWAKAAGP